MEICNLCSGVQSVLPNVVAESGFTEIRNGRIDGRINLMVDVPATYDFRHNNGGWNQVFTDFNTARLGGVSKDTQSWAERRHNVRRPASSAPGGEHRAIVEAVERE